MSSLQSITQHCAGAWGHIKRIGQTTWPWLPGKLRQQASQRCAYAFHGQCGKQTWLFLQASSQAEAAVERQHFIRETLQASIVGISWGLLEKTMSKVPAVQLELSAAE